MKNYKLPEVEKMKNIGFKFEFDTINEALKYIKKFAKQYKGSLTGLLFPWLNDEKYEEMTKTRNCNNDPFVLSIVKAKMEISKGKIEKQHYMFVVPPWLKDNKKVLIGVHQKRLETYMIDSRLAFFDCSYLGVGKRKAKKKVLHNELLQWLIKSIQDDELGDVPEDDRSKKRNDLLFEIDQQSWKGQQYNEDGRKLSSLACYKKVEQCNYELYELMFSKKPTVKQEALRTWDKINNPGIGGSIYYSTSIEAKENVIRQYLKTQTPKIRSTKNTRGTGINAKKKLSVQAYKAKNPAASISEISRKCNVDRKTVRKYLNE